MRQSGSLTRRSPSIHIGISRNAEGPAIPAQTDQHLARLLREDHPGYAPVAPAGDKAKGVTASHPRRCISRSWLRFPKQQSESRWKRILGNLPTVEARSADPAANSRRMAGSAPCDSLHGLLQLRRTSTLLYGVPLPVAFRREDFPLFAAKDARPSHRASVDPHFALWQNSTFVREDGSEIS